MLRAIPLILCLSSSSFADDLVPVIGPKAGVQLRDPANDDFGPGPYTYRSVKKPATLELITLP